MLKKGDTMVIKEIYNIWLWSLYHIKIVHIVFAGVTTVQSLNHLKR